MNELHRKVLRNPLLFIAFGFGSGLSPFAPGTMGTLVAIPLWYLMTGLTFIQYEIIVLAGVIGGFALCEYATRKLGVHDHPGIVWDEITAYWITMLLLPPEWPWALAGFVVFRFFDIVKPWPVSWCDRHLKGGVGVMLDDVLAGAMASIVLQAAYYFLG